MRAGTIPIQGGQRSRSQGESRDHPLVARAREPSLSLPPYPTHPQALMWPAGVPRAPAGSEKAGAWQLWAEPGWGGTLCNSWCASQDRSHALGPGWGGGQGGLGPALCLAPPDLQEKRSPRVQEQSGWAPAPQPSHRASVLPVCSALSSVCLGMTKAASWVPGLAAWQPSGIERPCL